MASWSGASQLSPTEVTAFTFLLFLLWLVFYGAGTLSVDALLRRVLLSDPAPMSSLTPDSQ